jgi:hypothetical protein
MTSFRRSPQLIRLCTPLAVCSLMLAGVAAAWAIGNADVASHRARLRLAEPPEQRQEVLAVQQRLSAEKNDPAAQKSREVVLVGQIGGMPNVWPESHPDFPWYAGQASFFLVDNKIAVHFAAHAKAHGGQDCEFCRQLAMKNAHAVAVVNLVDAQGKILEIDSRTLFSLREGQTVVVRGRAKLLAGAMLVVDADGIYLPR